MNVGIVGHEEAKFTVAGSKAAKRLILSLLHPGDTVVSGACHLGGIDVWAEKAADYLGLPKIIHPPKTYSWANGYKPRNLLIARDSDVVHVIVVNAYPPEYTSMRFDLCYHCNSRDHIKSGGCWTARRAAEMGKQTRWHIIDQRVVDVPATG